MFAVCVVHQHHGEAELSGGVHGLQAQDAGGGFLAAADDPGNQPGILLVDEGDKVSSIVDDDIGAGLQDLPDIGKIFRFRGAVDGKDVEALVHQGGGYVVLRAQGVGAGDVHFCSAGGHDLAQMGGFGLQMHAQGHFQALERLGFLEIPLDAVQQGHVAADPAELELAAFPQVDIPDVTCHN